MPDWVAVFSLLSDSGVYTLESGKPADAVKKAAVTCKIDYIEVDLKGVSGKEGLLRKMAASLSFPSYFGMNWDALHDCLTDMGWHPACGYVVLIKKFVVFAEKFPEEAGIAKDIFTASAQYWKKKDVPFYIILS